MSDFSFQCFLFISFCLWFHMMCFRQNGPGQAFAQMEVGSPPSAHDPLHGYVCPMSNPSNFVPNISQNSPSRLGQQPVQRFSFGRPPSIRVGDSNHVMVQPPFSSFNSGGMRSPGNSSFSSGMPWGTSCLDCVEPHQHSLFSFLLNKF